MTKEPPIDVVEKPKKKRTPRKKADTAPKPRTVSPRKKTAGKAKGKSTAKRSSKAKTGKSFVLPVWVKSAGVYASMGLAGLAFVFMFYYFFIRPYSYRWKPCYGLQGYGVCLPYGYKVHGFDISHHQGEVNWNALKSVQNTNFPIKFVFLKASEGGDFADKSFERNFEEARKNGFIRGAYHFYNPKTDPIRQAVFFTNTVKLQPGDLPPVLDIEVKSRDMNKLRNDLKIWLEAVEGHYKVKPILYTSYKYKRKYLNDSIFNTYPYWIAHYYVDSVRYEGEWKFWQHTDMGTLPGIDESVDLNVFNGSLEELNSLTIPQSE